jgi:formate dehydrogenase (NADP+) beta subunit
MEIAIILMGSLGLLVGVGLAIASKVFYVYVDPKILAIEGALPGANCGGCGYPGCGPNAEAIAAGKSSPASCVAAGSDVAEAIAAILGVSIEAKEPDIALPGCTYGLIEADTKFRYDGLQDCRAAVLLGGGMKVCTIGCVGLGTCARACPFDAIIMGPQGLPVVDEKRCTGCGTCERVCPKHIITLSSVTRRILKEYTTEDCTTPCQRACPAGINISAYVGAVAEGDDLRAVQIIKERNPFPTVIGRICPRPCENECRRQYVDEPVAINYLKRFAADFERSQKARILPYKAPETGRKLAVIGGGVEGLATAFFSARLGHGVTVYEAGERLGGLLRTAIARYRLPADILDWDIEGILAMGVTGQTGKAVESAPELLQQGYAAVFLAVGGWDSRLARAKGRAESGPAPDCHLLIDLAKGGRQGSPAIKLDGHVVIVGNPALPPKLIERCRQLGAESITVLVREPAAFEAMQDVAFSYAGLNRLFGQGHRLTAVELTDLNTGESHKIDARHVVFAAGRIPELIYIPAPAMEDAPSAPDAWEAFPPYKQPGHHQQVGLLTAGDPLTDFSAAIKAIAAGRRAAASIHKAMYGLPLDLSSQVVTPQTPVQNVFHVSGVPTLPRQLMALSESDALAEGAELERGFSMAEARTEAARCLRCGLICYKHQMVQLAESVTAEVAN